MDYEEAFRDFGFQMGEVVQHKTMPGTRLAVLSRLLEQWPGGFATLYVCRSIATENGLIERFYEHELQPFKIQ